MVNHVESQKRLIERLEDDVEVIVQQHQHFMDQLKVKQVSFRISKNLECPWNLIVREIFSRPNSPSKNHFQIAVMQKYRDLMESAAGDRIHRLESLLHETITDVLT